MLGSSIETVESILLNNIVIKEAILFLENNKMTDCIIGGGLLRNAVWNRIYGFEDWYGMHDIDVQYYDINNREWRSASRRVFNLEVNFKNQAFIHEMYKESFNLNVRQIESVEDGVASWAETCSCIGIGPHSNNKLIAPHGVEDLLNGIVRPNLTKYNIGYIDGDKYVKRIDKMEIRKLYPEITILNKEGRCI